MGRVKDTATCMHQQGREIIVVAVTKHASIDQIRELIGYGHKDLGENRVQVLVQHAAQVDDYISRHRLRATPDHGGVSGEVRWHMIGTLQRNKARRVLGIARLIHSLDSLRLAEEIQSSSHGQMENPVEVLLQVNVSGEKQKSGVAPAAAQHLIDQVFTMMNIRVRGLMCMAPLSDDPETSRPVYTRCHELFSEIRSSLGPDERFDILSMGMSNDFEVAIECGSNMVRIGTAIFGHGET